MDHFPLSACTAVQLTSADGSPYLFRTCDLDSDVFQSGAHPVSFPAGDPLTLSCGDISAKHSFFGITFNENPYWLLDGINDAGLCGGLLMLYEGTSLPSHPQGIIGMEFVTAMLAECADTEEVINYSENIRILDIPHEGGTTPAMMHFFFTDIHGKSLILEAADPQNHGKLTAYFPAAGILTNSPPYPAQLDNLRWFLAHSPELRGKELNLDGQSISPEADAPHLCSDGTFPASYAAYDRFIRAAVLKSINDRQFTDMQMLPFGYNIMHALFEPNTDGLFHYTRLNNGVPQNPKNSRTLYIIIYDIRRRSLCIRPHDSLAWSSLRLSDLPDRRCTFSICRDPQKGIIPAEPLC
ncbi:MAG: linear amide C-N hydrolase [Christensenellaceae bacterium]|nr:linear amide C-N hydrolase [Christensenellaceae bacterium]